MRINLTPSTQPLKTRFAPSPTGYLHLGHLAAAAFAYGIARAAGATIVLRIEDHDQGRSRPEYEAAIHDDLRWAGFRFDDQPVPGIPHPLRQSNRQDRYREIIDHWSRSGQVYRCTCTRAQIQQQMAQVQHQEAGSADELFYPGTCRHADHKDTTSGFGLRLRIPERAARFNDAILGMQEQTPARQCGDILLRDRHGHFTYQFAVAVDDFDQGINLVSRGEDLLHATGRQILTGEILGRPQPAQFAHHPLIRDDDGRKLGKRFFSEAIAKRRAEGARPEQLIGEALAAVGLTPSPGPLAAGEVASLFEIGNSP
jgi:glutamyl-tRNA synthetase/glutamyl-Q tRNA(Asp) synthetase